MQLDCVACFRTKKRTRSIFWSLFIAETRKVLVTEFTVVLNSESIDEMIAIITVAHLIKCFRTCSIANVMGKCWRTCACSSLFAVACLTSAQCIRCSAEHCVQCHAAHHSVRSCGCEFEALIDAAKHQNCQKRK